MPDEKLKIGQLARQTGLSDKAIRFYETIGVLPPPPRDSTGYRLYPAETVEVLRFVKQAQELGLTLAEIKEIVTIRRGGQPPCEHVYRLLQKKAAELDRKLESLKALRGRIQQSLRAWERQSSEKAAVCPHIEAPGSSGRPRSRGGSRRF